MKSPAPATVDVAGGDLAEVAARLRLAVARLERRLRRQGDSNIGVSSLSALATLTHHGPMTLGELAAHEGVRPPSVTRVVGVLSQTGLVDRTPDPADRRVGRVRASSDGVRLVRRIQSRKTAYLARRLRELAPEDLAALERALPLLEGLLETRS